MIKKLPRVPMRPEKEPDVDHEIWQPDWKCFCCHDSGVIVSGLASMIIDGYDSKRDKTPLCVNPGCRAASKYDSESWDENVDRRIEPAICQQLDSFERDTWRKFIRDKAQRIQDAGNTLAKGKSFRGRDRNAYDEQIAQEKHRLVTEGDWGLVAATPAEKKWFAGWEGEG